MKKQAILIVVVCRGNIARSPFAEAIIRQELVKHKLVSQFQVISRGVQGTAVDPVPVQQPNITYYDQLYADVEPTLVACDVDLSHHVSCAIDSKIVREANVLFALDENTQHKLAILYPAYTAKIHLISEIDSRQYGFADPETAENRAQILLSIRDMIVQNFSNLLAMAEKQRAIQ